MNSTEIIVRGVCVKNNKILLAYFKEGEYYFLPGGHLEHGESVLQTIERELKEEASLEVIATRVGIIFEHTWKKKEQLVHEMNFIVLFEIKNDSENVTSNLHHLHFSWVPLESLRTIKLLPAELVDAIENLSKNSASPLQFLSSLR